MAMKPIKFTFVQPRTWMLENFVVFLNEREEIRNVLTMQTTKYPATSEIKYTFEHLKNKKPSSAEYVPFVVSITEDRVQNNYVLIYRLTIAVSNQLSYNLVSAYAFASVYANMSPLSGTIVAVNKADQFEIRFIQNNQAVRITQLHEFHRSENEKQYKKRQKNVTVNYDERAQKSVNIEQHNLEEEKTIFMDVGGKLNQEKAEEEKRQRQAQQEKEKKHMLAVIGTYAERLDTDSLRAVQQRISKILEARRKETESAPKEVPKKPSLKERAIELISQRIGLKNS